MEHQRRHWSRCLSPDAKSFPLTSLVGLSLGGVTEITAISSGQSHSVRVRPIASVSELSSRALRPWPPMRLLCIDDDEMLVSLLCRELRRDGYAVDSAGDATTGAELFAVNRYDLVLLDWNLPDRSGLALCQEFRRQVPQCFIVMITGRQAAEDHMLGLDAGADDFLLKPFGIGYLKAHIRARLRRPATPVVERIQVGRLVLETQGRTATCGDREILLTPREYSLLEHLARQAGRAVTRADLLERSWDDNHEGKFHSLDVLIGRLRKTLAVHGGPDLRTRRGFGFVLRPAPNQETRDRGGNRGTPPLPSIIPQPPLRQLGRGPSGR